MNKVAGYLNGHIVGEVIASPSLRDEFSTDRGILKLEPELVARPKVTNDIRKIARFTWQLAEKSHVLPLTARGHGTDTTGGSIGKGIIVNTSAHLDNIIFIAPKGKSRFVHVQSGASSRTLERTLRSHGLSIPAIDLSADGTIGGAVARNIGSEMSGKYGLIGQWLEKVEVVLANGDLIETGRINKRELQAKKGLQTFEGDVYRKLDALIDENQELISEHVLSENVDNIGYNAISGVKGNDGSFDLTPLFVGSQGTLGIISEMVFKADFYNSETTIMIACFDSPEQARDAADSIMSLEPSMLDLLDGNLFEIAAKEFGKKFPAFENSFPSSVLVMQFNDFSERTRRRKSKKVIKNLTKNGATILNDSDYPADELYAIADIESLLSYPEEKDVSRLSVIEGASVPLERREDFLTSLKVLADKHHLELPMRIRWLDDIIYTRPLLNLKKLSDKQKVFKLINDYASLVADCDGVFLAEGAEGRLKANAAYAQLDPDVINLYSQVRAIFDPLGTLNPGVKQTSELRSLIRMLHAK